MVSQDAQGVSFRAQDREQKREVVLRRFFPNGRDGGGLQPDEQPPFLEAVEKLKNLKLKELRKTFDGGCDPVDGIPFLVSEWVEGDSLASFTRGKPLEPASVKDIVEVALRASQELSHVLGHETLWVGCSEDSLIVPESGRGITFGVEPLASLNTRGLLPVAELAERLLGWKGQPAQHDSAGDGMAGWIRQIKTKPKGWTLAQALEALQTPVTATAVTSTGPIRRAPGAATMQGASPTHPGHPGARQAKRKAVVWPWVTLAILLLLGGGGFAAWKSGMLNQLVARVQGPAAKRHPSAEEMRRQLAEKTMPTSAPAPSSAPASWNPNGPPAKAPAAPPAASTPAPAPTPAPAAEPPMPAPKPPVVGVMANGIAGKVIDASESGSKKTRYLEIFIGGSSRWVGYETKLAKPGLEMADLDALVGKNVIVTGQFRKEPGNRGDVLHIDKREDIQVQP